MHFDLSDLRLFCKLAESPSLTQGAQKAFISPAAASMRLKNLESQLNCRLFYRHNKGLDLTPDGVRLLHQARALLKQADHIKNTFADAASAVRGHVRIYANSTAVTEVLPEILAHFLTERAAVSIDLQEHVTKDILRGVMDGSADLGVVSGKVHSEYLHFIHFSTDRLVVITPQTHPLGRQRKVVFQDTLDYPYIGFHKGSTLQAFLDDEQAKRGVQLQTRVHVSGFESVCRMVEADVGISIVPESAVRRHSKTMNIRAIYLNEDWAVRERSMVVRDMASISPVTHALIEQILAKTTIEEK